MQRIDIDQNCKVFRFELPTQEQNLELPIGDHLLVRLPDKDSTELAAYPISTSEDSGFFDLVLPKPKNPVESNPYVAMSLLKPGQTVACAKVKGEFNYLGQGSFEIKREGHTVFKHVKYLGMIVEATDIAQMLSLIHTAAFQPEEYLNMSLLCCAASVNDILFKSELEELYAYRKLHLDFLLATPPSHWDMSSGELTASLLAETMPPIDTHSLVLVSAFHSKKTQIIESLLSLGYPSSAIQVFG